MLLLILFLTFLSATSFLLGVLPLFEETAPRLRLKPLVHEPIESRQPKVNFIRLILKRAVIFNRPLCVGPLGARINKDLAIARVDLSAEEFMFIKEILIAFILFSSDIVIGPIKADMFFAWIVLSIVFGYLLPEFWLKGRIKKVKNAIIKELPNVIDLLALCVNAGLDFMLALKWVIEKSSASLIVDDLNLVMQEINVGKTRRNALSDLSKKYDIADLNSFTRALIQADRMGTSVAEALNILSDDMRVARFRRGEQIALKAPFKMLVPLLVFIFPVVAILVGAPIFLDFMQNNSMQNISGGLKSGR